MYHYSQASTVSGPDTPSGQPVVQQVEDLPKPSEEAVDFLDCIGKHTVMIP